jgi:hypothetical protein
VPAALIVRRGYRVVAVNHRHTRQRPSPGEDVKPGVRAAGNGPCAPWPYSPVDTTSGKLDAMWAARPTIFRCVVVVWIGILGFAGLWRAVAFYVGNIGSGTAGIAGLYSAGL